MALEAGQLFLAHTRMLQAQNVSHHLIAEPAQKALDCSRLVSPASEHSERVEVGALITLMGTWTLAGDALDQALERLQELRGGPAGGEIRVVNLALSVLGKMLGVCIEMPYFEAKANNEHPSTPEQCEGLRTTLRLGYELLKGDSDPHTNIGAACIGRWRVCL